MYVHSIAVHLINRVIKPVINEVRWKDISEAVCMIAPIVYLSVHTGNDLWTNSGLVAICILVPAQKISLTLAGMLLQTAVIAVGFIVLFLSINISLLFVGLCMLLGAGVVLLESYGKNLRALANYIFVPTLYLACETIEQAPHPSLEQQLSVCWVSLPYILTGALCAIVIHTLKQYFIYKIDRNPLEKRSSFFKKQFFSLIDKMDKGVLGEPLDQVHGFMIAIALAVGVTTLVTQLLNIQNAQWAIWSSASVITGDIVIAKQRLHDRLAGTFIGAVMGIAVSFWVPHTKAVHDMCILLVVTAFAAFRTYLTIIIVCTALIFLAIIAAGGTIHISEERIINIAFGGVVGCAALIWVDTYFYYRQSNRKS